MSFNKFEVCTVSELFVKLLTNTSICLSINFVPSWSKLLNLNRGTWHCCLGWSAFVCTVALTNSVMTWQEIWRHSERYSRTSAYWDIDEVSKWTIGSINTSHTFIPWYWRICHLHWRKTRHTFLLWKWICKAHFYVYLILLSLISIIITLQWLYLGHPMSVSRPWGNLWNHSWNREWQILLST